MDIIDVRDLGLSEELVDKLQLQGISSQIDIHEFDLKKADLTKEEALELAIRFRDGFERVEKEAEKPKAKELAEEKPSAKESAKGTKSLGKKKKIIKKKK